MKKRIIALVLVIVMSLMALTSCSSGFNFANEDLTKYASFNYADFKAALAALEIEDGEFTTDENTRQTLVTENIYNSVADAIIAATSESEYVKTGKLGAGDVLYFVYYAVDEATGNVYYFSNMAESSITASSTKANHVIKLGDVDEDDEFMSLIKENLNFDFDLSEGYSILTASEIKEMAEEKLLGEKPDATEEEITAALAEAVKVKEGDTLVISYSRFYDKTDSEGTVTVVNESAAYETVVIDSAHPLYGLIFANDSTACVGDTLAKDNNYEVTVDGAKHFYKNVKILWKVENQGTPIATFKYTPYDSDQNVTPDNLRATTLGKVNLKDVELTYYVYPAYAISAPAGDAITASDILSYVYGSKLTEDSFELFEDETYLNGTQKLSDLAAEIAKIYDTKSEDNSYYAKDTELKTLLDAYNKAVEDGGSKPTDAQQAVIDETKKALTDAQNAERDAVVAKIVAASNGSATAEAALVEEYRENVYHSLKEAYDSEIVEKVQAAVWKLIDESVKVTSYPAELVEEYKDHLYEGYEYEYHKGDYSSSVTNYDKYESLEDYLAATLKVSVAKIDSALETEAKSYIEPIIKIYVVSKACASDAQKAMSGENGYVELDIKSGAYEINEEAYREAYGELADKYIADAKESAKENMEAARKEADKFIVSDEYMKEYKKEIGRAYYNSLIEEYGEINLRASFQFNRLFYYLTCTNIEMNEDGDHTETSYKTVDGVDYIDFRTVTYVIVEPETETENEEAAD